MIGLMVGAIVIVVFLLVAVPVGVALTGAVVAGGLSFFLTKEGEAANEGSELIALNK